MNLVSSSKPDNSLTLGLLRSSAAWRNGAADIVGAGRSGSPSTVRLSAVLARAERLAAALSEAGVRPGDAVATLAWNAVEHLEAYWAVPCMGAVLHTVNPRLSPAQIAATLERAGDRVLIVQGDLLPLAAKALEGAPGVEQLIVFDTPAPVDGASLAQVHDYEDLLAAAPAEFDWPRLDEHQAAAICFTSGTEGDPKGVVYSHRMLLLHALTMAAFDPYGAPGSDRVLAVVPMFHAMGWNLPYITALTGSALILPGRDVSPASIVGLIEKEGVTYSGGVPTIWADLRRHVEAEDGSLGKMRAICCGGSAVPEEMVDWYRSQGVTMNQGWGMTETGPGAARVTEQFEGDPSVRRARRNSAGRIRPLHEARVVGEDGTVLAEDGVAVGELEVRGPCVIKGYLGEPREDPARFHEGWLRTGDLASLDEAGWLRLADRAKDVIKSGGEWIPSPALESAIGEHPAVAAAAVVAIPDERWIERPLAFVVPSGGDLSVDAGEIEAFLAERVPRWWIPERYVPLAELPRTTVGKVDKRALRNRQEVKP